MGCATFGTPETPALQKDTLAVVVTPETFSSTAGCVPPLSFSVLGHSYFIAYTPICDAMIYLKFIILAGCTFMAAYILADSFRV